MRDITLRKALDDYKTIYMAYRNFAERTREEYFNDIEGFVEFAEKSGITHTGGLGLPIVERFVAGLEHNGLASLTRKRKVVAIRSLLSFLYEDGHIDNNIAKRVVLPFAESRVPYVLTQSECERLREACSTNPRDTAIIELLLQTGIRLSELMRLTLEDIEIGEGSGSVRINGSRSKKGRVLPLDDRACNILRRFAVGTKDTVNNVLFVNRFGESLGERGVQKMLRKYMNRASIGRASIHTLRHTFGAEQIAKGANLRAVQELMGHRDIRSTSLYTSLVRA